MHDKNCELYSATAENIQEMLKESKLMMESELNEEQGSLKKMSEEVFDIEIKYFEGSSKLHGRYDEDKNIVCIDNNAETSSEWTFWHKAFTFLQEVRSCGIRQRIQIARRNLPKNCRRSVA